MIARGSLLLCALLTLTSCGSGPETVHAPTIIPWNDAEQWIVDGRVARVRQLGSGEVRLYLADGRRVVVRPPAEGAVLAALERCGEPCASVRVE